MKIIMSTISNFFKMLMDLDHEREEAKDGSMIPEAEISELLELHNKTRSVYDLPPLEMDKDCVLVAQSHATWMANSQNISHMGFSFFGPSQRMAIVGQDPDRIGECISFSVSGDVKDLMKSWFTSESHKNIILGKYDRIGIGREVGHMDANYYWCAVYSTSKKAKGSPKVQMSDSLVDV
jgi:uncharacterized protein YkwD